jgi:hypothetical protein
MLDANNLHDFTVNNNYRRQHIMPLNSGYLTVIYSIPGIEEISSLYRLYIE